MIKTLFCVHATTHSLSKSYAVSVYSIPLYKSSSPEVAMAADNNIMLCDEAPMHCYLDMTRGLVLGIRYIIRQHVVDNR